MKNKITTSILGVSISILLICFFLGLTYSFFTAGVVGNERASSMTINTATLYIVFDGGSTLDTENLIPGEVASKYFTVTNTTLEDAYYAIKWLDVINEYVNDEILFSISCVSYINYGRANEQESGSCPSIAESVLYDSDYSLRSGILVEPGVTHYYTINIYFEETGSLQNYNVDKKFQAKLMVEGSTENTNDIITGNTIQTAIPTTSVPAPMKDVGDPVLTGRYAGFYVIPITIKEKNLFDFTEVDGFTAGDNVAVTNNYNGTYSVTGGVTTVKEEKYMDITQKMKDIGPGTYTVSGASSGTMPSVYLNLYYGSTWHYSYINTRTVGSMTATITNAILNDSDFMARVGIYTGVVGTTNTTQTLTPKLIYDTGFTFPKTVNIYLEEPLRRVGTAYDTLDYENGLLTRRIGVIESYDGETINTAYISSKGTLTTGATVYYVLETPTVEYYEIPSVPVFENAVNISIDTSVPPSPYVYDKILADNEEQSDVNIDFIYNSEGCAYTTENIVTCAEPLASQITNGLYYTANRKTYGEDEATTYYYRGDIDNNWVTLGGYKWRIMRTTSEGGVKLIYSGDASSITSGVLYAASGVHYNDVQDNKYYVGYTYNLNGYTALPQSDSTAKGLIDTWYNGTESNNLGTNFGSYLSPTAVYCVDRTNERISPNNGGTFYPSYFSMVKEHRPTFACSYDCASRYTVSPSTGNGFLTYPIAMITMDEAHYAGLIYYRPFTYSSYLMDNANGGSTMGGAGRNWWTINPVYYAPKAVGSTVFEAVVAIVGADGAVSALRIAENSFGLRPVVALKSCVSVIGGDGSQALPYRLSNVNC